jgi:acid phosphatase family membrane protein YuiD
MDLSYSAPVTAVYFGIGIPTEQKSNNCFLIRSAFLHLAMVTTGPSIREISGTHAEALLGEQK